MEIDASNVAWHNFFLWEVKLRRQRKSKFGELSTEEIQEITDNAIPVTTKKSIKFEMRIINGTNPFKFPLKAVKFQT